MGLLAAIFILLFKLARLPFKVWALMLSAVIVFYCIMVDCRPPVTRATIMILVFLFGRVLKKRPDGLNSLALSAILILFFDPQDIFDVGFQLSFFTVGSIIYCVPNFEDCFLRGARAGFKAPGLKPGFWQKAKIDLARLVIVSLAAWLGSAPLIACYFNIFSPITILANLLIVPWMFFVLAASVTFIIAGLFSTALGLIFAQTAGLTITILLKTAHILSRLPFSFVRVKSPHWIYVISFYMIIFVFLNRGYLRLKAKYFLITALIFINLFVWFNISGAPKDELKITFLDVGKGDSFVLELPGGGVMLIDGGEALGADMGRTIVERFLSHEGINKVDVIVSTHPHTDHVGGLVTIIKDFKAGYFIENGDREENPLYLKCQELIKQKRIKRFIVKEGDRFKGLKNIEVCVLNPPPKRFRELNSNSLVIKLAYKNFRVLFCADILEDAARGLVLKYGEKLRANVLKIPHHGGNLGEITPEFIGRINPEKSIISVRNRRISDYILLTSNKLGVTIYRTDIDGAITVKTDGNKYEISGIKNN